MPDWTYHPVFRPLLRQLPARAARDLTLRTIGAVAALPGGGAIVREFGDMRPPPVLALRTCGTTFASPVGVGGVVDPHLIGLGALARFGIGYAEIAVSVVPIAGTSLESDDPTHTIRTDAPFENDGLGAIAERLDALEPLPIALAFRLTSPEGTPDRARAGDERLLRARLAAYAALFIVDEVALERSVALGIGAFRFDERVPTIAALDVRHSADTIVRAALRALTYGAHGVGIDLREDEDVSLIATARSALPAGTPIVAAMASDEPAGALAAIDAGATLVTLGAGFVFAGPLLPKRINDALAARIAPTTDSRPACAQPWFWALALGTGLIVGGILAWLVAATRVVLPYDEAFLGWTRDALAARVPRLLAFMTHDRITLAGSMISIGILYAGIALGDLRRGAPWAKKMVVVSSYVGLATYWLWLGYGYWDPLHALLTVIVLPFIVLASALPLGTERPQEAIDPYESPARKRALVGQLLFVVIGFGFIIGGLTIATIGITSVFVPTDLVYLRTTGAALHAANAHLVPLVAHDRAGFGGDLAADGVAILFTALWGFRGGNRGLWWTIFLAGIPGFGAALGVHIAIGYLDPLHLAPPVTALVLYVCGLALSHAYLTRPHAGALRPGVMSGVGVGHEERVLFEEA